jgi:hypothetical protein
MPDLHRHGGRAWRSRWSRWRWSVTGVTLVLCRSRHRSRPSRFRRLVRAESPTASLCPVTNRHSSPVATVPSDAPLISGAEWTSTSEILSCCDPLAAEWWCRRGGRRRPGVSQHRDHAVFSLTGLLHSVIWRFHQSGVFEPERPWTPTTFWGF